jgi:hypothetical protein
MRIVQVAVVGGPTAEREVGLLVSPHVAPENLTHLPSERWFGSNRGPDPPGHRIDPSGNGWKMRQERGSDWRRSVTWT